MNAARPIHQTFLLVISIACLLFIQLGCGGSSSRVRNAGSINADARADKLPEYRIGVLDELEVRFFYHERFNETAKVRPDGRITLENVGDVYVLGMTPRELDQLITDAYSKIVFNPEVTVFVRGFASQGIYVAGEIDNPGLVELQPNMTVLKAITAAGGPISGAKLNSVIVLREDEYGKLQGVKMNLSRGLVQNAAIDNFRLQPQDIVFVPRTFIASVNRFLSQIYAGLFPPIDIYLRTLREYNRD